ncbi:hemoglobin/transferrin/lactoferrin receptor protein [Cricetibacter osteomyelitidis]|uniref:Hemoglobin/transferrin/lactoferrin receptor protein n=1 Tax=Cricetibacter osteomyelitidis TaxID=1521931 RepID=A0A4R2SW98_9PAST|nr:TonB-dependent hemoglobin/transferrin/lactoferrin family receptor [Cricetibacter osteomyelitidis]TCP94747.1 hemoglobin/transferrin/lactoferrin receptor protein [Cricetibacter osteomyelitidis]
MYSKNVYGKIKLSLYYSLVSFPLIVQASDQPTNQSTALPVINVVSENEKSEKTLIAGRSVLTLKNIEQQQSDNAADLVSILPGTNMAGGFRPGGQTLNINGMGDAEDIRIQLDDTPKNFERYQQGALFIEPELLRKVTVDKGNYSPQYGNGGFAGTIKFETKEANDFLADNHNFGGLLKYGYNTNNAQRTYSGGIFFRNPEKNFDGIIFASSREAHDYKRPNKSNIKYSANNQKSVLFKSNWHITPEQLLAFSAAYGAHNGWEPWAAKRDIAAKPSVADISKYGEDIAWKRKLVYRDQDDQTYSLKYNYAPANYKWLNLSGRLTYSKTKMHDKRHELASASAYLGSMGNESWISYSDITFDLNNTSNFILGRTEHNILVGIQWLKHQRDTMMYYKGGAKGRNSASYNYGYFQPYYMPSGRQYTQAFYLQDQINIRDLTLSIGTRYDHIWNVGEQNLAPRYNDLSAGHDYGRKSYSGWSTYFGLDYQLTPNISLFSNFNQSWRAPVVDEQYEVQYKSSTISASSLSLQKEKINQLRVGTRANFDGLISSDDNLQFKVSYFNYYGKNEIFKNRGILCENSAKDNGNNKLCSGLHPNYRNLPGYRIQGVELELYYQARYAFGSLTYSYVKGERNASPRNPWGSRSWIAETPPRKLMATLGFNVPSLGFTAGWKGEFVRRQDRSPLDSDPNAGYWALPKSVGYSLHGLFATWQPTQTKGLTFRLSVDNLFNKAYYPYLGELASGLGRNVKFSISKQF